MCFARLQSYPVLHGYGSEAFMLEIVFLTWNSSVHAIAKREAVVPASLRKDCEHSAAGQRDQERKISDLPRPLRHSQRRG